MLSPFTTLIVAVTRQTGKVAYRGGVAGAAGRTTMIDAGPFLINPRFGMRQVEARRNPSSS